MAYCDTGVPPCRAREGKPEAGFAFCIGSEPGMLLQASRGQQNGNSDLCTLCDDSRDLDLIAMSLVETERLSYAIQGGDIRIQSALELLGRRSTQYSS